MTPIAQVIPQDILHEIFVHIGAEWLEWLDVGRPERFPWYLGHICSQWRTTLLSMPPRGLKINEDPRKNKDQRNNELTKKIVKYFLKWKRGCQFDLVLSYDWWYQDIWKGMILDLLVTESARWRHVTMDICHRACGLHRIKDHLRLPSMQSLRLIDIYCPHCDPTAGKNGHLEDVFANTPSLTHVRLPWMSWNWGFDWSNFTYLHLQDLVSEDYKPMCRSLQQAINLNTLVTDISYDTSFCMAEGIITLPRLDSWHVSDYRLLDCIKAPALQNLYLHGKIEINAVTSFLRESGCKLQSLALFDINVIEDRRSTFLVEILQHASELVHLKLFGYFGYNIADLIKCLNVPIPSDLVGPELPAPRLQSLEAMVGFKKYTSAGRLGDGLSKLVLLRNGQAKNKGGRPVERLKSLIVGMGDFSDENLIGLCKVCRVELRLAPLPDRCAPVRDIFEC